MNTFCDGVSKVAAGASLLLLTLGLVVAQPWIPLASADGCVFNNPCTEVTVCLQDAISCLPPTAGNGCDPGNIACTCKTINWVFDVCKCCR